MTRFMRWFPGIPYAEIPDMPYELWAACRASVDRWEAGGG